MNTFKNGFAQLIFCTHSIVPGDTTAYQLTHILIIRFTEKKLFKKYDEQLNNKNYNKQAFEQIYNICL